MLLTFEGGEAVGKSTQANLLVEWLHQRRRDVILTREPGGTPAAEIIRDAWASCISQCELHSETELALCLAARFEHAHTVLRPALQAGRIVVCDRFVDSTIVYQGYVGGLSLKTIADAHVLFGLDDLIPRKTFIFMLPRDVTEARLHRRTSQRTGYDLRSSSFHDRVAAGFAELGRSDPFRYQMIDATLPVHTIHQLIKDHVEQLL